MENSKKILRDKAKIIRDGLPDAQRQHDAEALRIRLEAVIEQHAITDGYIGTYRAIGSEIQPPYKISNGKTALPVPDVNGIMQFYPWEEGLPLVDGVYDIPIPITEGQTPVSPDILLLPLLLCDKDGHRLGYGAGYYDRYLARCLKKPLCIGVCFDEQVWNAPLPIEPHDKKLDLIVTPKRIIEII